MATTVSKKTGNIEIQLTAYRDCDDVQLFWRTIVDGQKYGPVPDCLGFMIERQRKKQDGTWASIEVLRNRVGFSDQAEGTESEQIGNPTKPSSIWPFQTYNWTDHGANNGETIRYQVVAMRLPTGGLPGSTPLERIADSGWTEAIEVNAYCGGGISTYFNRGFVMSQFVARLARKNQWKAKDIKDKIKEI